MSATRPLRPSASIEADRAPLVVRPRDDADASWSSAWVAPATWAFVALGIWLRASRALINSPLWGDESMLAANLIDRGYRELAGPLANRQVCPVLFLWIERAIVDALGFTELTLRLFPMLCGIASVLLFRRLAVRLMSGVPVLLAVAVFAVSGWPIRYSAEVKPYASDLLAALALLSLAVEWWRRTARVAWLWALAASGPLAVSLSYPSVFVAGGVGLALLPTVARDRRAGTWAAYSFFLLGVVSTFGAWQTMNAAGGADRAFFLEHWARAFPPLDGPFALAAWLASTHTGFLFAYPDGGERGASGLTTACFVAAVVVLWRRGRGTVMAMALIPFALGLAAAAVRRYPYGMSNRTMQYLAPAICLLAGLGAASLLASIREPRPRRRIVAGLVVALAVSGLARDAYLLRYPYRLATEDRARSFARWFWVEKSRDADLIRGRIDLGCAFRPEQWEGGHANTYLCLQKIYSPRQARGRPAGPGTVAPARPLRVVFYNESPDPSKDPRYAAWLADISRSHEFRKAETLTITPVDGRPGETSEAFYLVHEFAPRPQGRAVANTPATPDRH